MKNLKPEDFYRYFIYLLVIGLLVGIVFLWNQQKEIIQIWQRYVGK